MASFSMKNLPALMKANNANHVIDYGPDGVRRSRSFAEIHRDACAALAYLRGLGHDLTPAMRVLIAGNPGYDWLVAALACLFAGAEIVAFPESLEDGDAARSLDGIAIDLVLADDRMIGFGAFGTAPRLALPGFADRVRGAQGPDILHSPRASVIAFTSGSTSTAKVKAFRVDLESTADFADAFTTLFGLEHDDLWVVLHSFSHIVHLEYVLGGLGWGYDIALVNVFRLLMNGAELRPSVLVTVPSVHQEIARRIRLAFPQSGPRAEQIDQLLARPLAEGESPALAPEAARIVGDRLKVMIIGAAPSAAGLQDFLRRMGLPLFEGYGMSETNMIACNVPGRSRRGTVGQTWPGIALRLDGDGVILARTDRPRSDRYLNIPAEDSAETFLEDGWVNTGDIGEWDKGFLRIVGRKKEIIINSGGENINASAVEARLREIPGIEHVLVFGDGRPFLVAVLAPPPGGALPPAEMLRARIDEINRAVPAHEQVMDFIRLETAFDVESGLLTRSGKPRRGVVALRYEDLIGRCYG